MNEVWPLLEGVVWPLDSRHVILSIEQYESSCQKSLSPQQDFAKPSETFYSNQCFPDMWEGGPVRGSKNHRQSGSLPGP